MFTSLPQFYNSQEWRNFRRMLIMERTNKDNGVLYDEYNGQPIVKSYDCVLHHKTPLNMQNVNDYSVSLNPNNIMIVSQKSHNEIHARFGYCTERKVFYVYGAPCAGKTTFVNGIKGNADLIVDMDNIWQCITGGNRYEKPNALKVNAFAVRDLLLDQIRTRAGKWERAFIIDGGAIGSDRRRKVVRYGAESIFIDTNLDECLKRLYGDSTRSQAVKAEWEIYIRDWFAAYTE